MFDTIFRLPCAMHARWAPRVTGCFVRKVLRYATGRLEEAGQQSAVRELQRSFSSTGYNIRDLMFDVATSRAFHEVGEVMR